MIGLKIQTSVSSLIEVCSQNNYILAFCLKRTECILYSKVIPSTSKGMSKVWHFLLQVANLQLGNSVSEEYPFIAITPSSTQTLSGSTV